MIADKNWFAHWFNTPYYHLLYGNRNYAEAELFIKNIATQLSIKPQAKVWDMACGKGRHCIYLNKLGYDVCGTDLSAESIKAAKQHENDTLNFYEHDMRKLFRTNYFDYTLNLFTSFGYFESNTDNETVIANAAKSLKTGGIFIIDYFNATFVLKNLISTETKKINEVNFTINKKVEANNLLKHIAITDDGKKYNYCERVKLFTLTDFEKFLTNNKLDVLSIWGDYTLQPFSNTESQRLIIAAKKK
jgi:SAM-dependent methyltransferase